MKAVLGCSKLKSGHTSVRPDERRPFLRQGEERSYQLRGLRDELKVKVREPQETPYPFHLRRRLPLPDSRNLPGR